jgi:hypothetical protein
MLRTNHNVSLSESELYRISVQLPSRPGRVFVGEEHLMEVQANTAHTEPLDEGPTRSFAAQQDRLLLRFRFWQGLRGAEIALLMRLEQKQVYRRIEQLMRLLRRELESRGVDPESVVNLLEGAGIDSANIIGADAGGIEPVRPSIP